MSVFIKIGASQQRHNSSYRPGHVLGHSHTDANGNTEVVLSLCFPKTSKLLFILAGLLTYPLINRLPNPGTSEIAVAVGQ